jgi:hypothetical protein
VRGYKANCAGQFERSAQPRTLQGADRASGERALDLTQSDPERRFLIRRLKEIEVLEGA